MIDVVLKKKVAIFVKQLWTDICLFPVPLAIEQKWWAAAGHRVDCTTPHQWGCRRPTIVGDLAHFRQEHEKKTIKTPHKTQHFHSLYKWTQKYNWPKEAYLKKKKKIKKKKNKW